MPKLIGITLESKDISDTPADSLAQLVPLTTAQARKLPASARYRVLNTSDKGSRGTYAKRWWNYYAYPAAVFNCEHATRNMTDRALRVHVLNMFRENH